MKCSPLFPCIESAVPTFKDSRAVVARPSWQRARATWIPDQWLDRESVHRHVRRSENTLWSWWIKLFRIYVLEHRQIWYERHSILFYNTSPPRMFLSLDLLWEYWIQHGANGPLYVTSCYSTWIFCRGVSGFATDCPCDVWCRGLTTCLLHVGPPFGTRILNNSWAVGLT